MFLSREPFGTTADGKAVESFTLRNDCNMTVQIITYGGIITSLRVPDRAGRLADVVLGFNTLPEYLAGHPFFGALVGRYGNRIAGARFTLNGREYRLAANDGANHLHGGLAGFDKKLWEAEPIRDEREVGVKLTYLSPDGEEGYPGNLAATVTYRLNGQNELSVHYEATTDRPTVVNLTQHTYFNLAGEGSGTILEHEMMIQADRVTAVGPDLIPTGELRPVAGTALDFRTPKAIGAEIAQVPGGYDHNYVLNKDGREPSLAARVREPHSGRVLEVFTTEPGMQFYSANFLDGSLKGKAGAAYGEHSGFCLETQHFPDSPNQPAFPSTVLNPGETYRHLTIFKFSA
jgi:aldose 1-epimerase